MTRSDPRLDRRELLRATAAGAAGLVALPATGAAQSTDPPEPDEYEDILAGMDGDGSAENPYVVTDVVELQAAAGARESSYELGGNVDASATSEWHDGAGFTPIGTAEEPFAGTLTGNGNEIRNVTIDRPDGQRRGVFALSQGEIQNLTVTDVTVTGGELAGGFVGHNFGILRDISVDGTVSGAKFAGGIAGAQRGQIADVTSATDVSGTDAVGGVSGNNKGTVTRATASGSVSGTRRVGGIVGDNTSRVTESVSEASVSGDVMIGGLIGKNNGVAAVRASRANGSIEGTEKVGGLIGEQWGEIGEVTAGADVSGEKAVGGLLGQNWGTVRSASVTGSVSGTRLIGGLAGWNASGGVVETTYVSGSVAGEEGVGAIVGRLGWEFQEEGKTAAVRFSYWDNEAIEVGGVGVDEPGDGDTVTETVAGLAPDQMRGEAAASIMESFDFDEIWRTIPDAYPRLRAFTSAEFEIVDLSPESVEVPQGDRFSLTVTIENTSEWDGRKTLEVLVGDGSVGSQQVPLEAGEQRSVQIEVPTANVFVGSYTFTVRTPDSQKTGSLVVEEAGGSGEDTPTATPTESPTDSADGDGPGFTIPGAIASLGGGAYLLARRLRDDE